MQKIIGTLAAVLLLSAASFAEVTKEDLKKLAEAQVSDGVVLAYVRSHGPMPKWSAQDMIELEGADVSENVLEQIAAGDPKKVPTPAPVRTDVIARRVHVVLRRPSSTSRTSGSGRGGPGVLGSGSDFASDVQTG